MKVLILGTSNSILKNGWSYGLRDALKGHEVVSMSVGASPGIQFAEKMSMDFTQYDHVFFDSIPNDEEYAFKAKGYSSTERNERVMYEIFSTIASQTSLIVLGFTNSWCFDEESTIYASRKELAHQVGAQFIDIRKILTIFLDGNSIESIYEPHPAHPKREIAYQIGRIIGAQLQGFKVNKEKRCFNYNENFIVDEIWASSEQAKKFSNSLLSMNVITAKNGFTLNTKNTHACLGFYINSYSTHCSMSYTEADGTSCLLRLTYKQSREEGKFLKVFVPFQSSPRITSLTIGNISSEDCKTFFPVMTQNHHNPKQEIHLSSMIYWDDSFADKEMAGQDFAESNSLALSNAVEKKASCEYDQMRIATSKLKRISDAANTFFADTKIAPHIIKAWNYKDTCFVMDFEYRGVKFAIDFNLEEDSLVKATIINRKGKSFISAVDGASSEIITEPTTLNACLPVTALKIEGVMKKIDTEASFDVSVVIPVHNREKLVLGCIDSLNSQSLDKERYEVIFVDDFSTDKSIAAIDYHIDKDVNYKIIKREVGSGNASTPRNEGIKAAKGRYIFFLDSDDKIDSMLLENGLKIADRNDSDIVYFKIVADGDREVPIRPFKNKIVDKADVTENHLMRSLTVFKMFKLSMLKKHNILFNPQVTVAEDKIFMVHTLSAAKNVSILADRDYHTLCFHGDGHLSRRKFPLEDRFFILNSVLNNIYFCDKTEVEKRKLYNGWLIICLEMMEKLCIKHGQDDDKLKLFFRMLSSAFNVQPELADSTLVYEKHRKYIRPFMDNNFDIFNSAI